ncbi:MAG: hypothetical protein VW946_05640 [Gammaproteobacteria bacterium]
MGFNHYNALSKKNNISMNTQLLENLEVLKKGLVLLSKDRKVVLPHHKSFEHVERLRAVVNESIELLKNEQI